jgi:5-deoxy-glucuronate isomerase
MNTQPQSAAQQLVFRKTNTGIGRQVAVSPDNSSMKHLAYARIILNSSKSSELFSTRERETGLICLNGDAEVCVDGVSTVVSEFDAIYIPRDSEVEISTSSSVDLAEFSAEVSRRFPLQIVRYADVIKDAGLHFRTGNQAASRELTMMLAKNIEAGRLIAGLTQSDAGNWTSWPPHEHARMLEEMYVYCHMPYPAYGIQLVYNDTEYPEFVTVVRDGDAVLMPSGYHPNVSVPGQRISFLWAMAAHREVEDRQFGVVNVQPDFSQAASGLDPGKRK